MAADMLTLFPSEQISFEIPGGNKKEIVKGLLELALRDLDLIEKDRNSLLRAVMKRENSGSTGAGRVAIPHVKTAHVTRTLASMAVFPDGVDFDAVDGEPVFSLFLILSPQKAVEEHLEVLRWIAGVARSADYTRFVRQTRSAEEVRSLLEELGA